MTEDGLDEKFQKEVIKLQELKKKHDNDPKTYVKKAQKIADRIKSRGLVEKCEDTYFANQLLMVNNINHKTFVVYNLDDLFFN